MIKTHIDQLIRIKNNPSQHNVSYYYSKDSKEIIKYAQNKELENIDEQISYWSDVFRFWHLAEIFIMSQVTYIHGAMNNWIRRNISIPNDTHQPNSWNLLYHHLIRGDIDNSTKLFRKLCTSEGLTSKEQFLAQKIEILIANLPKLGNSLSNFEKTWNQWHQECLELSNDPTVIDCEFFSILLFILLGDKETLSKFKFIHWIERIGAEILFKYPTITNRNVRQLLQQLIDPKQVPSKEYIFGYIIQGDISSILISLEKYWGSWVFCHLTDLFYHLGFDFITKEFRENSIVKYSFDLLQENSFWQIAFSYFSFCDQNGQNLLDHFIQRIPLDSDKKAFKLINLCRLHKLKSQEKLICQVMAMNCLQRFSYGAAMSWLQRINDDVRIRQVISKMISSVDSLDDIERILQSLGSDFVFSDNLKFLVDFQKLLEYEKVKIINEKRKFLYLI